MSLAGWEMICEMDRAGMEIGSHTLSHPRLDLLSAAEAENEIHRSKQWIEERLHHAIDLMAFPYGQYNHAILSCVKREYSGAVTTRMEMVRAGSDPYLMGRVDTYYMRSPFLFQIISFSGAAQIYFWIRKNLHEAASRLFKRAWA
jgi:peptidoglycan/xylan/chitin deacetylase (PgdA/CDA1 family)